jgi:hypothetical protein
MFKMRDQRRHYNAKEWIIISTIQNDVSDRTNIVHVGLTHGYSFVFSTKSEEVHTQTEVDTKFQCIMTFHRQPKRCEGVDEI